MSGRSSGPGRERDRKTDRLCLAVSLVLHGIVLAVLFGLPSGFGQRDVFPPPSVAVDLAPPPAVGIEALAEEVPETDATPPGKVISPFKTDFAAAYQERLHLGRGELKTGAEVAFSMRRLADYVFTLDEYCGHYRIEGEPERFVSILDARRTLGRLLFYDSRSGLYRALKQFSTFIFTYGPDFLADEPVVGSVLFMPRKDFEQIEHVDERGRLLWQHDLPPARVATRITLREREMVVEAGGQKRPAVLVAPAEPGARPGVALLSGGREDDPALLRGLGRILAVRGLAALAVGPAGQGGTGGVGETGETGGASGTADAAPSAGLARAALALLARQKEVDRSRVGLFGQGAAAPAVLATLSGWPRPAFAAALFSDAAEVPAAPAGGYPPPVLVLAANDPAASGPSGASGPEGRSGPPGASGPAGQSGPPGASGPDVLGARAFDPAIGALIIPWLVETARTERETPAPRKKRRE